MAIRNIRIDGDEVLRKHSREVIEINSKIVELVNDMLDTMYKADGVGLAAPQIGILKRVIIVDIGEEPIILINPELLEKEGEYTDFEGCLSIPGKVGEVVRPKKIKVSGFDLEGNEIVIEAKDLLARVLCHEIDHLDGILFKDKAPKLVRSDDLK